MDPRKFNETTRTPHPPNYRNYHTRQTRPTRPTYDDTPNHTQSSHPLNKISTREHCFTYNQRVQRTHNIYLLSLRELAGNPGDYHI
jgi:hypothetical protein